MLKSESFFGNKREPLTPTPSSPFSSGALTSSHNSSLAKANALSNMQPSHNEAISKLIVGPNIKLKGVEITDCDTLVVEGRVEATMSSRIIHIAENGMFKGSADIDVAEVHGEFEGNLSACEKLVIYSTGRVSGKISYGKVVIEEGGQLIGEVQASFPSSSNPPSPTTVTKKSISEPAPKP